MDSSYERRAARRREVWTGGKVAFSQIEQQDCAFWAVLTPAAPTDEELRELSRAAFSEVEAEHQRELERLFNRIAAVRRANASARQLSEK